MPNTATVKFCRKNQYGHLIFVSTQDIDIKAYFDFDRLYKALKTQYPDQYLHCYKSPDKDVFYIQFQKYHNKEFTVNSKYEINYTPLIRTNQSNRQFVSLRINTVKDIAEPLTEFCF